MILGRRVFAFVALASVLTLVAGTGGVSSMQAERTVEVTVADDDTATLGFEQTAIQTPNGTTLDVTVRNRFSSETSLKTLRVDDETARPNVTLGPGESVSQTVDSVDCSGTIVVVTAGSDVSVTLTLPVDCS